MIPMKKYYISYTCVYIYIYVYICGLLYSRLNRRTIQWISIVKNIFKSDARRRRNAALCTCTKRSMYVLFTRERKKKQSRFARKYLPPFLDSIIKRPHAHLLCQFVFCPKASTYQDWTANIPQKAMEKKTPRFSV